MPYALDMRGSGGLLLMNRTNRLILCLLAAVYAAAGASLEGTVADSSGAVIAGAQIGVFTRVGLIAQTGSDERGQFSVGRLPDDISKLVITADGFATRTIPLPAERPLKIELDIAPASDSIRVAGTAIDVPASEQASAVSIINREELRRRNEPAAVDLLRYLPGIYISQTGQRGGTASMFVRGGDYNYNLVQLDGISLASFTQGGYFDLSQVPSDLLDRVEVVRGSQSAIYGSYANSSVINLVSRTPEGPPNFDILAEGGSHNERRFAVSGSGTLLGSGIAASASQINADGEVGNADWRNQNVLLHLNRNWTRQSFSAIANVNSNEVGTPGPYGSDPLGLYSGLDLLSRNKNNASTYGFHYAADITTRVRGELHGGLFLNSSYYIGPFGDSYNKDIRGEAEARAIISFTRHWTAATGFEWGREEMKNTFVTDSSFRSFPLRRDVQGIYWDNRFQFGRIYLQAGVRGDIFQTPLIPAFDSPFSPRPEIKAHTDGKANPKVAAGYSFASATRVHASAGTGIRAPGGYDLAFTTNPDLRPEQTVSVDGGISQSLAQERIILDATYFYNRYRDLIVSLGGSLTSLSAFTSDNLANARSRGLELSAQARPYRWASLAMNYTYLDTTVLALDRSTGLAQNYYQVGQQLARRPPHSGSFSLALNRGRFSGNFVGYFRGETLDVEPNFGASAGFFRNPGYANLGVNLNVAVGRGVTLFGNLRNALNDHYEEVFGFPSLRLNFVSGVKWSLHGRD
jgi:outer membrane cobalamin receptor